MISVSGCQLTWILYAQPIPGEATGQGRWLVTLAAIFIVPALLAVMTAFARIVILLYFLRAGLGSQVLPPNLVVVGIAVVLTWFVMAPAAKEMQTSVLVPLWQGRMTADAAVSQMQKILRSFMVRHVGMEDYRILAQLRDVKEPPTTGPIEVLTAAYALSELRIAFLAGLLIYLPFLVVDVLVYLVVSALGPATFSPQLFALPAKILFFVMVDGWRLLFDAILRGYTGGG